MRESEIQAKVTEEAKRLGMITVRINVVGRKGWPDFAYGYKGRILFIEYKKPGEKPTPLQKHVHSVMREHGFDVFVVDDVDDGINLLRHWKGTIDGSY